MKTAIQNWQNTVHNYRQEVIEKASFWQGEHAHWYDNWMQENNYAAYIYPWIQPYVYGRALDIGAGSGIFTAWMLEDARKVDVLEPSADMCRIIESKGFSGVDIIHSKLEDAIDTLENYDFMLAAHSLFNVAEIDVVLPALLAKTGWLCVLIGTGLPCSFHAEVRAQFGGNSSRKAAPPNYNHFQAVLDALDISAEFRIVETLTRYSFSNHKDLFEDVLDNCKVSEHLHAELQAWLNPHVKQEDQRVYYSGMRQHALFVIRGK